MLTNRHLLLDGWSTPLLLKELLVLYATDGDAAVLPHVRPYRDSLAWIVRTGPGGVARRLGPCRSTAPTSRPGGHGRSRPPATPNRVMVPGELTAGSRPRARHGCARSVEMRLNTVIQVAWAIVPGR